MKRDLIALLPLLGAAPLASAQDQAPQPSRPNIIHIMTDDHAFQAISAYGHPLSAQAPTPNLDRLASQGMLFRRAYVENSLSTPSRACLMTGLYSHQNGQRGLGGGIDTTKTFVSEILQDEGYETGMIGKWHMQCEPKGFDTYMVFSGQGEYYNPGLKTKETSGEYVREEGYATELVTKHAIEFLESRDKDRPFALFVHHKAPHRNWMPALQYLDLYEDVEFPIPENFFDDYATRGRAAREQEMGVDKDMTMAYDLKVAQWLQEHPDEQHGALLEVGLQRMTPEERAAWDAAYNPRNEAMMAQGLSGKDLARWKFQRYIRDYMRCIKSVDDSVGELLDYLDEHGLRDNTIVVYTSDQGFYMGEHGWFDKRFMYEESFRTPLIIRYPPMIAPGSESEALVQNIDFAPTYLDIAGIEKPQEMVGTSLVPVFRKGGKAPRGWRKYLYYHYYDHPAEHNVSRHDGVCDRRCKLINFYDETGARESYQELYDLRKDPHEMNNVIGQRKYRRVLRRLSRQLEKFRSDNATDEC